MRISKPVYCLFLVFCTMAILTACSKKKMGGTTIDPDSRASVDIGEGDLQDRSERDIEDQPVDVLPTIQESDIDEAGRYGTGLEPVFFAYNQWEITEDQISRLEQNAQWLQQNTGSTVLIEGHCDERGTEEYNLALGEKRAEITRRYLINLGISPDRLRTISYGESRPFEAGHDELAWQQNRRAHFVSEPGLP